MDNRRLILFMVFSLSIMLLWEKWQESQKPVETVQSKSVQPLESALPSAKPSEMKQAPVDTGTQLQSGETIQVKTDILNAEIDTLGGDLRRIDLPKYRDSKDPKKPFSLMQYSKDWIYIAQSGLIGASLPTHKSRYSARFNSYQLKEGEPTLEVRLSAEGDSPVKVDKIYTFHRNSYVIDVGYEISNGGGAPISPSSYFQLLRDGNKPEGESRFTGTFTGFAVYTEKEKFSKIEFADTAKAELPKDSKDGWIAAIQHYFVTAWMPSDKTPREYYTKKLGENLYSAGVVVPVGTVEPGKTGKITVPFYAGPQDQSSLAKMAPGLDLVVDYGRLTIIAKPIFWYLSLLFNWVQNWGVAIILLTVTIKLLFFPLSAASYKSMANMRKVGPKLQMLKEQYGDDKQKLHTAMMELYKTEKINPLGGCLPMLVQIPVFISLYWVLLATVELKDAPFMLWIHDLSAQDPYYILPLIMGITMILQTKMNPTPPDPIQAKVMQIMPIVFSIFFFFFPAGLVLYWLVNNVLSIAQQWYITRSIEQAASAASAKR